MLNQIFTFNLIAASQSARPSSKMQSPRCHLRRHLVSDGGGHIEPNHPLEITHLAVLGTSTSILATVGNPILKDCRTPQQAAIDSSRL